jgi:hypothetical protein
MLFTGPAYTIGLLKEFTTDCRLAAIEGGPVPNSRFHALFNGTACLKAIAAALSAADRDERQKDMLVQLSYIGRALPKGRPTKEGLKAQTDHKKNLSSSAPPLPEGRREALRAFARSWAERHLGSFKERVEFDPTAGSCLEFSRRQGGMAEFLRSRLHTALEKRGLWPPPAYLKKLTGYPVIEDDVYLLAHAALRDELIDEVSQIRDGFMYPKSEVLTISERGFKTRIVTKSHGAIVALAHHLRRWLAGGLRTDPAIVEVLAGDHRAAVESLLAPDSRISNPRFSIDEGLEWIVSADLKTATDLIGLETYEAIVEGILESPAGKTLPKWAADLLHTCIGPQILNYKDLGRQIRSKRGALMGLPTTWPLLCLSNLAWWSSLSADRMEPRVAVRICGDDLVAKGTKERIARYEQRARDSGAMFSNRAKHMVLQLGGVFTEEVFYTSGNRLVEVQGPVRFSRRHGTARGTQYRNLFERWSEAFPLRGILGTMKSDITGTEAPYWSAIGPAFEQMMADRSPGARVKMLRTLWSCHPELRRFLNDMGLAGLIHVPRQFGGVGIPRPTMWDWAPKPSTTSAKRVVLAAKALAFGLEPAGDMQQLSRPWSELAIKMPLRTIARRQAEAGISSRYQLVKAERAVELPMGTLAFPGTVDSLQEVVEGNVARDLFFLSEEHFATELFAHRNAAATARRLRSHLFAAREQVIREMGGWLIRKERVCNQTALPVGKPATNHTTWAVLLSTLQERADNRVAVLRPDVPRDVSVPFERLDTIVSKTVSLLGRPGGVSLWSLPLREWPARPTEKALASLFSSPAPQ